MQDRELNELEAELAGGGSDEDMVYLRLAIVSRLMSLGLYPRARGDLAAVPPLLAAGGVTEDVPLITLKMHAMHARLLLALMDNDAARDAAEKALAVDGVDAETAAEAKVTLAAVLVDTCRDDADLKRAEGLVRETIAMYDDEDLEFDEILGLAQLLMGKLLLMTGQSETSCEHCLQLYEAMHSVLGDVHPLLGDILHLTGSAKMQMGKAEEALEQFDLSLKIRGELDVEGKHSDMAKSLRGLGQINHVLGKKAEAKPFFERARLVLVDAGFEASEPRVKEVDELLAACV